MDPVQAPDNSPLRKTRFVGILLLLLVGLGLVDWWYEHRKETRYDEVILRTARLHGVDPALVKAVILRESKFNPRVRGRVGEIGLMQVRPLTAEEWAKAVLKQKAFEGDLFNPETNVEIGTWYLGKLLLRYRRADNPVAYALADYNAGRSNVLRWNRGPAETNSSAFVTQITFPGTQDYLQSIQRRATRYRTAFQKRVSQSMDVSSSQRSS